MLPNELAKRTYNVSENRPISDNELIQRWIAGDVYAYNEIVQRYKDRLTNFSHRILQDYELAVDVAQECFIRVYLKANTFQGKVKFSTWLYKIATNLSINELNRKKRRNIMSFMSFFNKDGEEDAFTVEDLADAEILPDEACEAKELSQFIQKKLASIPATYRVPLVLREMEGHSYEEIMEILDLPEGTVKSRINRAKSLLKKVLANESWQQEIIVAKEASGL
jgi:RNA polymerase sigma-70 factor (ECF subfamily)